MCAEVSAGPPEAELLSHAADWWSLFPLNPPGKLVLFPDDVLAHVVLNDRSTNHPAPLCVNLAEPPHHASSPPQGWEGWWRLPPFPGGPADSISSLVSLGRHSGFEIGHCWKMKRLGEVVVGGEWAEREGEEGLGQGLGREGPPGKLGARLRMQLCNDRELSRPPSLAAGLEGAGAVSL